MEHGDWVQDPFPEMAVRPPRPSGDYALSIGASADRVMNHLPDCKECTMILFRAIMDVLIQKGW